MRKAIQVLILLAIATVAALGHIPAQAPPQCRVTKTFYTLGGQPDRFATVTVFSITLGGSGLPGYTNGRMVLKTDAQGRLLGIDGVTVGVDLPQGSIVRLYSNAQAQLPQLAANPNTGTQYQVPNKSTATLEELTWNLATFRFKGDLLIGGTNGIPGRFGVCANGETPVADSAQPFGWRCGVASGGGSAAPIFYENAAASYTRTGNVGFIRANALSAPQTIDLGPTSGFPVEVYKSDTTNNPVTITYGASSLGISYSGAWAKFIPNGVAWVLWSFDPTSGGVAADAGYAYVATATYTVPPGIGYVDCDAASTPVAITVSTPAAKAVEFRKSDLSTNACTINYGAGTLVLNATAGWGKIVPNGAAWVLLGRNQ